MFMVSSWDWFKNQVYYSLGHMIYSGQPLGLMELDLIKIKLILVGFSGKSVSMLSLILVKFQNLPIPTMKIQQIQN